MLHFKGFLSSTDNLPESKLPNNAVRFKEPTNMLFTNILAVPISAILVFFLYLFVLFSCNIKSHELPILFNAQGLIAFFLTILPHEILHAVFYPKNSNVEIYFIPKANCACVWSDSPLTKRQFILMSFLPFLVLSIIPTFIWFCLPNSSFCGNIAIGLASYSCIGCSGDFINIFNAAFQMPSGSKEILYKMNSYWYMEE